MDETKILRKINPSVREDVRNWVFDAYKAGAHYALKMPEGNFGEFDIASEAIRYAYNVIPKKAGEK